MDIGRKGANGRMINQMCCTKCEYVDVNEMTDERYCSIRDYKQIKLWRKHRPDWCPILTKNKRIKNDNQRSN